MAITAAMVKELREMTGAGMMDCKKALNNTDGDMDKAVEFLRENGLAKAVKNNCGLKVLGNGELNVALTVKAAKFSASAKEAIEAAKGTAETL